MSTDYLRDDRAGNAVETIGKVVGLLLGLGLGSGVVLSHTHGGVRHIPPPLDRPPLPVVPPPPLPPPLLRPLDGPLPIRVTGSSWDGCYHIDGYINDAKMSFILDTGATFISIPAKMAGKIGFHHLRYTDGQTYTANGIIGYARVKLTKLTVQNITLTNVDAIVSNGDGPVLLGNAFFNMLQGFDVSHGIMTLKP